MLPAMRNPDGISKWRSVEFGGIVHTLAAGTGDIWLDQNIVADEYPVMVSRPAEHKISQSFKGPYGCLQIGPEENDTILLGGSRIRYKGEIVQTAATSFSEVQTMTPFNRYAIIMPAKRWVRTDVVAVVDSWPEEAEYGDVYCVGYTCKYWDGTAWQDVGSIIGNIEAHYEVYVTITDGEYAGEPAEANTINIVTGDFTARFKAGDAITMAGDAFPTPKTLVVREVYPKKMVFYEHSFDDELTDATKFATFDRTMPDLDMICVNENRVWGYHGQTIYASKLGDMTNWNVFDGLATDSYAVDVLNGGDLTGCVSFMGYPVFFKEDGIFKVYGNRPSNFEVMGGAATGCINGRTLAVVDETLYYLSRVGIMSYNGGYPAPISDMLGDLITGSFNAAAVADGSRYLFWYDGTDEFLEFDGRRGMWHRQKLFDVTGTIKYGTRYNSRAALITTDNELWAVQSDGEEERIPFFVEFADFTEDQSKYPAYGANKKGTSKIQLRMALEQNSSAMISMRFDSEGDWHLVKLFQTDNVKKSFYLPIIPRRSDHFRIRIEGEGRFELWSLARENYKGSAL